MKYQDPALYDLVKRYQMDEGIWNESKRGFPFNISLNTIIFIGLGLPVGLTFILIDFKNNSFWKLFLLTFAISIIAYYVADSLITQFKDSLSKNGLSGKDLNKAGKREDKPAV